MDGKIASDERARELAAEILQRPEYADGQTYRLRSQILERLIEWLRDLSAWFDTLRFESPALYWTLLLVLLVTLVLLLAHVTWSIHAALTAARRPPERRPEAARPHFTDEAAALARGGQFLAAAHRLQLAAIELLLNRNLLDLSRFEPNRVLRRRLREARLPAAERDDLLALLDRLETRWFRDRTEDDELYRRWQALYERLERLPA